MTRRGFGLVEVVIVLMVVALAGALLYKYVASTAKEVGTFREERPLAAARLAADLATAATIHGQIQIYHAQHGQWPADKDAVLGLLGAKPRFQCAGNDFEYESASGQVRLTVDDPARC